MKKYRIRFLEDTVRDKEEIRSYLSHYYENTASRFFRLLKEKISRLKDFPYSCQVYEYDQDYRVLIVEDYLVFYIVNDDDKAIEIHRIFHGSKDIREQFNKNKKEHL